MFPTGLKRRGGGGGGGGVEHLEAVNALAHTYTSVGWCNYIMVEPLSRLLLMCNSAIN